MNVQEVVNAIYAGKFNADQLRLINDAIRVSYRAEQGRAAMEFRPRDRVEFNDKLGRIVKGIVTGRTSKAVKVFSDDGVNWKVSASFLRKSA
jgi:hypothetical protein